MKPELVTLFKRAGAVKTGGPFRLASGRESDLYVDAKAVLLTPRGIYLAAKAMEIYIPPGCAVVADDGCAALLGALLYQPGTAAVGGQVRPPKDHGLPRRVAWGAETRRPPALAVPVEDVCTTGGSLIRVVEAVRAAGVYAVTRAVCLVDRGEGAKEALAAAGVELFSVLTRADLEG